MFADAAPRPGDIVSVRARQYLVENVEAGHPGDMTLVRLSCLEDDAQGVPLEILCEAEVDAHPVSGNAWGRVAERGFDEPRTFAFTRSAESGRSPRPRTSPRRPWTGTSRPECSWTMPRSPDGFGRSSTRSSGRRTSAAFQGWTDPDDGSARLGPLTLAGP